MLATACGSQHAPETSAAPSSDVSTGSSSPARTGEAQIPEDTPQTSSTPNTPSTLPHLPPADAYTEIVQTPKGARTFNYYDAIGEGARIPQDKSIKVDCVAQDKNNQAQGVIGGYWYVIDANDTSVPGEARITPANSYYNTTDPEILKLPLNQQPVYDHLVPFCSEAQIAALGLNPPR